MTYKSKIGLLRLQVFYPGDFLNCLGMKDIAAQTVNCIGWINYETSLFQNLYNLLNPTWIRIIGVNFY